jgi:hypothetical protein
MSKAPAAATDMGPPIETGHIRKGRGWQRIAGIPRIYLDALQEGRNTFAVPPDRPPWPAGKLAFDAFVKSHGGRCPETVAAVRDGKVVHGAAAGMDVLEFLQQLPDGHYFCKQNDGSQGAGALRVDISEGAITIDGQPNDAAFLARHLATQHAIVQASVTPDQHPDIARFNPNVTNTVRLVTFLQGSSAVPESAALRIALDSPAVDNWTAGGVAVPIEMSEGLLGRFGALKSDLSLVQSHPHSGEAFFGRRVPHWSALTGLACRLHEALGRHSLGWDIAVLQEGPCILECNRFYDVMLPSLDPQFPADFLEHHLLPAPRSGFRLEMRGRFGNTRLLRAWLARLAGLHFVSGRIEECSSGRAVVLIAATKGRLDHMLKRMTAEMPEGNALAEILVSPARDRIARGFFDDLSAAAR